MTARLAGVCPHNKRDESVQLCQGDLMLCPSCNEVRFGHVPRDIPEQDRCNNRRSVTDVGSRHDIDENTEGDTEPELSSMVISIMGIKVIINPLLAYVLFSMQAGTADNIRVAVTGHFPLNAIVEAKNLLWNACDPELIGEKAKRKDSASRTESEAHVQDILHGLQKLDKNDKLPCVMINTMDIGMS